MMSHKQISNEDCNCISRMLKARFSFKEIARTINKDPSAVGRHITMYGGRDNYDVKEVRRQKRMKRVNAMQGIRKIKGELLKLITRELKNHKSPEQIAGILKRKRIRIVATTIYRYIKERAPHLKQFLRSKKGRYRRKGGTKKREEIREKLKKKRVDERPKIVERRGRIGDFEGDTMMGKDKRVRICTFVDRRSGYLIAFLLPKMNAQLFTTLTLKHLRKLPRKKKRSITFDNGIEFSDWENLERFSKMDIYFAYPYHAWERGTNENTNGLLRQYFPKNYDFNLITEKELQHVVRKLNQRERKRLGFLSPHRVFWGLQLGC